MTEPAGHVALRSVVRLHHVATSIVNAELTAGFGFRLIDYLALDALSAEQTEPVSLSYLARRLGVHATTIAAATGRLQSEGLVRRWADPNDRRAVLVLITDDGLAVTHAAYAALEKVSFGLPGLSADQNRMLIDLVAQIRAD